MIKTITDILSLNGIKNVGFCDFDGVKEHLIDCRAKNRIPQIAKTIIICAFPYKIKNDTPYLLSRYAAVPDYHTVCGAMLEKITVALREKYPKNKFEWFCDNSPIPEVYTAAMAGLGVKGDNGLLITKEFGSFVFLGEIVTDLQLECENCYTECSHCGNCKKECPVSLEKSCCLSNLSQKKQISDQEAQALRKNNILWGCDICQNTCPMNKKAKTTDIQEFIDGYRNEYTIGENTTNRPYTWRGEAVIKRNYYNLTNFPKRKALRLKDYDYSTPGYYFITICTQNKKHILSNIVGQGLAPAECRLSALGKIVEKQLLNLSRRYNNIKIDKYVIMPNHIHAIIEIKEAAGASPRPTLSDVICAFKSLTAHESKKNKIFQISFYDHVIRGEQDYQEIWQYIENNPQNWSQDEFYIK